MDPVAAIPRPFALLAELTHRCPLHCVYCSNPIDLQRQATELGTDAWLGVIDQARDLGVVQLHLSGGEPLLRPDLEALAARASQFGIFTNLITSGIGLTQDRARGLADAGLNSVQLSLQSASSRLADRIGGRKSYAAKQSAALAVRTAGLPLSMNVVLHRINLHELEEIIDLCASWGAERLELANTQYYGWAHLNRAALLPSRQQLVEAEAVYARKKTVLSGRMELIWVLSDYYEPFPKPCMGGWARITLTVSPNGTALPCPVASSIETLRFSTVREHRLEWIWYESPSFNRFRGFDWMQEPCRSCTRRFQDFGGCRCQAFALTGDASRTDPVCQWAPDHHLISTVTGRAEADHPAIAGVRVPEDWHHLRFRRDAGAAVTVALTDEE